MSATVGSDMPFDPELGPGETALISWYMRSTSS